MCDYSLHHVATRPAKIDDRLVTTKFPNSITRGFAAAGDPRVAVCLLPGTELAFDRDVECVRALPIFPTKKIGQKVAQFHFGKAQPGVGIKIPGLVEGVTFQIEDDDASAGPEQAEGSGDSALGVDGVMQALAEEREVERVGVDGRIFQIPEPVFEVGEPVFPGKAGADIHHVL